MKVLEQIAHWPVDKAAAGVTNADETLETAGDVTWTARVASITKMLVAYAGLVAVEEGSVDLEAPAGPSGSTVRHLLAHASGLPFNGDKPVAQPGQRRVYSNTGFDVFGQVMAKATGIPIGDYLHEGVLVPLGMASTELRGSPAWAVRSNIEDLLQFGRELLTPTLVSPTTLAEATREQFEGLGGVVPGFGSFSPNPWGLGFELKDAKSPHWTAPDGSPRTFGHFGGSGSFMWVDPDAGLCCVAITNRDFADWAPPLWSALGADVLHFWLR